MNLRIAEVAWTQVSCIDELRVFLRKITLFGNTFALVVWIVILLELFVPHINLDAERIDAVFVFTFFDSHEGLLDRLPKSLFALPFTRPITCSRGPVWWCIQVWTAFVLLLSVEPARIIERIRGFGRLLLPWLRRCKQRILFTYGVHVSLRELPTLLLKKHLHPLELEKLVFGFILDHQLIASYLSLRLSLNLVTDFWTFIYHFETIFLVQLHSPVILMHDIHFSFHAPDLFQFLDQYSFFERLSQPFMRYLDDFILGA